MDDVAHPAPLPARLAELYLNVGVPQLVVQKVNVHARRTHWHAPLSANVVVLVVTPTD